MKTATKELLDLLHGSDEFQMADLYTITLSGGQVLRHTSADMPVVWAGQTYEAHKLIIKRGATRIAVGLDVDSNALQIASDPDYRLEGLQWAEAAWAAYWTAHGSRLTAFSLVSARHPSATWSRTQTPS